MKHTLTLQQQDIIDEVRLGHENLIVNAKAGSSKTTVLVEAADHLPMLHDVVCAAFNTTIAYELKDRMPPLVDCRTTHSIGYRAIRQALPSTVVGKDRARKSIQASKMLGLEYGYFPDIHRFVGLAKSAGLHHLDVTAEDLQNILDVACLDTGKAPDPIGVCQAMLQVHYKLEPKVIDFDDMLMIPVRDRLRLPHPDLLMIDEAQDISPIQRQMLHLMTPNSSQRIVAVGDIHQAIYAFRGADSNSMTAIAREWDCKWLPLSVSFRCPLAVVQEAQRYVPDIEPWGDAPGGTVGRLRNWSTQDLSYDSEREDFISVAILCRNNKPLVSLALKLIKQGIGARVRGRDVGEGLISLLGKSKARTIEELLDWTDEWGGKHVQLLQSKGNDSAAEYLSDKLDCLEFLAADSPDVSTLRKKLERMFTNDTNGLTLSTIHKAKGLEFDQVFILDSWLMPSKFAKEPEQIQQESNLAYVAITRSQRELYYVDSRDFA